MNLEQEFDRRLAAIHGLGRSTVDAQISGKANPMDIRHAEFQAMADVFLGHDYDPVKRKWVEDLQIALHQQQAALYRRLEDGALGAEEYVAACNALIENTFRKCEEVLGPEDFRKLFGTSPQELKELIDRQALFGTQPPQVLAAQGPEVTPQSGPANPAGNQSHPEKSGH